MNNKVKKRRPAKPCSPLIVRTDHVFCSICMTCEPIHAGDGTPIDSMLEALISCKHRHPNKPHENPFKVRPLNNKGEGR